ncbi:MAG: XisI protein [Chloroflexota bacterium]
MDKLNNYRRIVQQIVARHGQYHPSHGRIEAVPICDTGNDNYLLMDIGWDRTGRVHAIAFHVRIREGKIWVEWDGTEEGIAQELLEAGVTREDIVLGFYRPETRSLTGLAVV